MAVNNLKETHPQRYYLKLLCRMTYIMGFGDCWYEETERSRTSKVLYAVWATAINSYIILGTLNEVLANFRSDLNTKEKNDLIQFSLAHPSLCAKYIFLVLQKDRVRVLFKRLVGEEKVFTDLEVERRSVKVATRYAVCLAFITYSAVLMTCVDAFKAHHNDGIPFRTEVTLIPSPSNSDLFSQILRFLAEFHWWAMISNMVLVDGLSIFSLVYIGHKFKLVGMYFDNLRVQTLKNQHTKSKEVLMKEYEADFVTGIKFHENVLWCAKNVQHALGNIYGAEVLETTSLLVMCLIKLVDSGRNMTFLLANLLYIGCLLILNGSYMMAAGDVTYEAAELHKSIFYSGWEVINHSRGFRALAVVALQRSQKPVIMTAFGVITLSHSNLISVIRSSYSFFAVMY